MNLWQWWQYATVAEVTIFAIWIFPIMMIEIGYINESWKSNFAVVSNILESNNKLYERVLEVLIKLLDANQDDENIRKKWPFTILIVEDKKANACVYADGKIFITTEMLEICDNDDKLAIVLGHELAHISHKHHEIPPIKYNPIMAASISWFYTHIYDFKRHVLFQIIWKIIFASYFLNPIFLKGLLWDLPYSRQKEREADETGFKLCRKAHFNVEEGPLWWDKMEQMLLKKLNEKQLKMLPEYFSTHPSDKKRSEHLTTLIQKTPLLQHIRVE